MRLAHDGTLHFRVPAAVRDRLDERARASGVKLSTVARNALAAGLAAISSTGGPDDPPPPAAPAARAVVQQAA